MSSKKQAYADYRKIRDEAQELAIAERNLSAIYKMEREEEQRIQKSEQIDQANPLPANDLRIYREKRKLHERIAYLCGHHCF